MSILGDENLTPWRWVLDDPVTGEHFQFENNPHDAQPYPLQKNVTAYALSADDGFSVLYEGMDTPQEAQFTISVLSGDFYNSLVYWYSKRRQVLLTDDLEQARWIYFTQFTPTRKYSKQHPFWHDVVMQYLVIGQQGVTAS